MNRLEKFVPDIAAITSASDALFFEQFAKKYLLVGDDVSVANEPCQAPLSMLHLELMETMDLNFEQEIYSSSDRRPPAAKAA